MATKENGSDVRMATAAVGTEDGGGRRRLWGRGRRGVSGCWRTGWLPGKFLRKCRPLTNQKWAWISLSLKLSFSFKLHLLLSQESSWPPCTPQPPPHSTLPIPSCTSSMFVSHQTFVCVCDHVWSLLDGFVCGQFWPSPSLGHQERICPVLLLPAEMYCTIWW